MNSDNAHSDLGAADFVIETERLHLSVINENDASFLLDLLNDPDFIRFIGDRQVRTIDQAKQYISGLVEKHKSTRQLLLAVTRRESTETECDQAIGICSLLKRDELDDYDIGFAFLPQFRGQGFALEATQATIKYAKSVLEIDQIIAIANPGKCSFDFSSQKTGNAVPMP